MAKNNDVTVYTYRYIWKSKDSKKDLYNVKYITGAKVEHDNFMSKIVNDENVVSCSRIYVSEVNISLTEQHEIVKKERK